MIIENLSGVLFDVDGTLVDSNDQHAQAFADAFAAFRFEIPYEKIRPLIGMGGEKLIPAALGRPVTSELIKEIGEAKSAIFHKTYLVSVRPFPRARESVLALREGGIRLGIASSASKKELDLLLEQGGLSDLWEKKTSADDARNSKPDPDIVLAAIGKLGLPKSELLMIGDTPYDIAAAQQAGIPILGVLSGGWSREALHGAVRVIASIADFGVAQRLL